MSKSFRIQGKMRIDTNILSVIQINTNKWPYLFALRNTKVITKGETAEYLAIILSGKMLIKTEDAGIGTLETGDMIGFMAFLDLPGYVYN